MERFRDFCRVLGDSHGVVSALECIGDKGLVPAGRKSKNLGLLGGLIASGVAELELFVSPAVEDTVETIDGGGEGVSEREGGAGGDGDPSMVLRVVFAFLEGLVSVELAVPM